MKIRLSRSLTVGTGQNSFDIPSGTYLEAVKWEYMPSFRKRELEEQRGFGDLDDLKAGRAFFCYLRGIWFIVKRRDCEIL